MRALDYEIQSEMMIAFSLPVTRFFSQYNYLDVILGITLSKSV